MGVVRNLVGFSGQLTKNEKTHDCRLSEGRRIHTGKKRHTSGHFDAHVEMLRSSKASEMAEP